MIKEQILSALLIASTVYATTAGQVMLEFVFLYPLFMSCIWMTGAIYYYFQWERRDITPDDVPDLPEHPFISILVPCCNEEGQVYDTIKSLARQNYPFFEIIAINDGSVDRTGQFLDELLATEPRLRVIHHAENQGKAMALRSATMAAKAEYLICIDCDTVMHPNAIAHLLRPFLSNPRLGAVTGNPRVRSRSNLLAKVQIGEYSSIIGIIKRAQRVYGRVFTVSGVICGFRRRALDDVGYWSSDMITEDIDISWKLQRNHWGIQYVPNAVGWILVPETFRGLWKQRLRWAQGGAEAFLKYFFKSLSWRQRRMWGVFSEYILSVSWAFVYMMAVILFIVGRFCEMPPELFVKTIFPPAFWGLVLATTCMLQCLTSLIIEARYEPRLWRILLWTIWYPMMYWALSAITTLVGFPRAIINIRRKRATWSSPTRRRAVEGNTSS